MATKTKRIQVKTACINCRKKHQGCDNHRPCTRCINSGNEETCKDIPHKRGKPKTTEKPLSTSANSNPSKKIYTLNDLMTTVEDIVVGKLEEENTPLTMMTINTEDLSQNSPGVRRSQTTRKYQSKWTHTHFQRPMKKSKSCDSVPLPPFPVADPPIMTWTIPQFINPVESNPPFLPPSLTYNEPLEPPNTHHHSHHHHYPQRPINDNYGMIPADAYGEVAFNDFAMGSCGDGLSLGSPSSEGSSDNGMENSVGMSGGGCFEHQGWVDPLDWFDLQMSEELFEN
jgi:hypothetical protein